MHRTVSRKAMALVAGLTLVFLSACGGGGGGGTDDEAGEGAGPVPEPSEPVTITFSSWVGNEPAMKKLAKTFHEEHPNITIKFENTTAERSVEVLTTRVAGGNPPDVAYIDASETAAFASRGALVNLDNYIERSDVVKPDDYVESFKTFTTYENSLYGLPFDGESTGLFYRTDLFEEAGIDAPPATWEEFEAAAKALTDGKKQYGVAMFASESAYYWYPWLWQAGGDVLSPDRGEVIVDSDKARQAAEYYVGLTDYAPPDYLNSDSYNGRVAFANGQAGMYVAGAWFAGVLSEEFPKLEGKWDTAPLPEGPEGCATTIAGDSLVMFSDGDKQDAAWKWVEFLSQPEILAQWTYQGVPDVEGSGEGTLLPPLTSLLESDELMKEKPILKGFADSMECGVSHVAADPNWGRMEEALNEALGKAMYGEITSDEALETAKAEMEKIR